MLKSEKFFIKRDPQAPAGATPLAAEKSVSGLVVATPVVVSSPRVVPASIASVPTGLDNAASVTEARSKLIVGSNIKLKGLEITDCDTLVVEGRVEATISSRVIQISDHGIFVGNADFDVAEIRGEFNGDLTVRQKLVVYPTGRVSGRIRYGKLVIEEGGQLTGDVALEGAAPKGLVVAVDNR